eukprot:Platyproteum_vivax@DN7676_c0_g2_i6.p1
MILLLPRTTYYRLVCQVEKPAKTSEAGRFKISLKDANDSVTELSEIVGPLLTTKGAVDGPSASIGSRSPDTETSGTVRFTVKKATAAEMGISVNTGYSYIKKGQFGDKTKFSADGFKMADVVGFNQFGHKVGKETFPEEAGRFLRGTVPYRTPDTDIQVLTTKATEA